MDRITLTLLFLVEGLESSPKDALVNLEAVTNGVTSMVVSLRLLSVMAYHQNCSQAVSLDLAGLRTLITLQWSLNRFHVLRKSLLSPAVLVRTNKFRYIYKYSSMY